MPSPLRSILGPLRMTAGLLLVPVALIMLVVFLFVHVADDGSGVTATCLEGTSAVEAALGSAAFAAVLGVTAALSVGLLIDELSWQVLGLVALVCGGTALIVLGLGAAAGYDGVLDGLRCPMRIYE